jgi:hypothetical protein
MTSADLELFHVSLRDGSVRTMTIDQVDEAFNAGVIDAKTPVVRAGDLRWSTLGEIAGLDDEAPPQASYVPSSVAPMALDDDEIPPELRPKRRGRVFAKALALVVIAGLGYAGTQARPDLVVSAKAGVKTQIAKLRSIASKGDAPRAAAAAPPAEAPKPTPAPQATATPATAAAPATVTAVTAVKAEPTAPSAAPSASASAQVPTLSPRQLPNARPGGKRRGSR